MIHTRIATTDSYRQATIHDVHIPIQNILYTESAMSNGEYCTLIYLINGICLIAKEPETEIAKRIRAEMTKGDEDGRNL